MTGEILGGICNAGYNSYHSRGDSNRNRRAQARVVCHQAALVARQGRSHHAAVRSHHRRRTDRNPMRIAAVKHKKT